MRITTITIISKYLWSQIKEEIIKRLVRVYINIALAFSRTDAIVIQRKSHHSARIYSIMTANNVITQSKSEGKASTWKPEQEKSILLLTKIKNPRSDWLQHQYSSFSYWNIEKTQFVNILFQIRFKERNYGPLPRLPQDEAKSNFCVSFDWADWI